MTPFFPIIAVIVVGLLASAALGALDKKFGITDRVIQGIDEMGDNVNYYIEKQNKAYRIQRTT